MSETPIPHEKTPSQQKHEQRIAAIDKELGIEEFSLDDVLRVYYVRRSSGDVERWCHVGQGPDRGKFISPDGKATKYLDTDQVLAEQEQLSMEYMVARAKAITDIGAEAAEAVPVVGPQEALADEATGPTDELTPQAAVQIFSQPVQSAERVTSSRYDYLRDFLPPVTRPAGPINRRNGMPVDVEDKQRAYYDRFVTEENREDARETLIEAVKATPLISKALAQFDLSPASIDAVDAIRENPDVRFAVAKIIAQKLDRLLDDPTNDMGERVNSNSRGNLKVDPMTGKQMPSRVYAVDMALKMIGGEFAQKLEGKDDFRRNADGRVVLGQHRHAASSALMSYF